MARQRTSATELARLLHSASQPIYVLDDEQTLVYCNRACLNWVGQLGEELLGQRCAYHSSPEVSGAEAVAAGLCPPPQALGGPPMTGFVSRCSPDGRARRRRARFYPLGDTPEESVGLMVVVDNDDLPEGTGDVLEVDEGEADSTDLHRRIERFRADAAGRYRVERLVGTSPAIQRARAQVEVAATTRANVLIVGPPGSGRQHVASTIHNAGVSSAGGSLIPLACAVLGPELIYSTVTALAAKGMPGGRADHTALLLNDVDSIPAEAQLELAHVLTAKAFPLRLIATARRSLGELARQDEYREDLAALFSTIEITLPPSVQRREDLPLLAQLFLEDMNARSRKQVGGFTAGALDRLDAYTWPGNVDELSQAVSEAHRSAEGPEIESGDLPKRIHLAANAAAHPRRPEEKIVLDELLASIEKELIRRALARSKGNKAKAARLLGMTRPRLYRRLVQLGFEEECEGIGEDVDGVEG